MKQVGLNSIVLNHVFNKCHHREPQSQPLCAMAPRAQSFPPGWDEVEVVTLPLWSWSALHITHLLSWPLASKQLVEQSLHGQDLCPDLHDPLGSSPTLQQFSLAHPPLTNHPGLLLYLFSPVCLSFFPMELCFFTLNPKIALNSLMS
jgi:hypothetical protein